MSSSFSPLPIHGHSSETSPVKWHEFHCDPILDIVLLSKDGVHFRASSHALRRESSFFDDMLSATPNPYQSPSNPIALDFNADVIALFLDNYAAPGSGSEDDYPYGKLSLGFLRDYEVFIRHLDCDRFLMPVKEAYHDARRDNPIECLILASHDDDITSAKLALTRCREQNALIFNSNVFDLVDQMRPTWQYPLIKSLLDGRKYGKGQHFGASWPSEEGLLTFVRQVGLLKSEGLPQ